MHKNAPQREPVTTVKVRFALMGFDQNAGIRLYTFEATVDGTRTTFTVSVDLALIPAFGIQIQELPLLCRELLERQVEGQEARTLTLTDTEMRVHADHCAMVRQAAALRRAPAR